MLTALARIEGRPVGVIANNPMRLAGAITSDGADKAARLHAALRRLRAAGRLADRHAGDDGRPRGRGDRRSCATARACSSPAPACGCRSCAVILRKAYGLGAQAMAGGSLHEPLLTVGWPTAELGAMGLEGAVKLGFRRELEAIADEAERAERLEAMVAHAHEHAKALNAATLFELDDVIDPAETRRLLASTLAAATAHAAPRRDAAVRRHLVSVGQPARRGRIASSVAPQRRRGCASRLRSISSRVRSVSPTRWRGCRPRRAPRSAARARRRSRTPRRPSSRSRRRARRSKRISAGVSSRGPRACQ